MNKNEIGKVASAVIAAAGPALAGYAANAAKNVLVAHLQKKPAPPTRVPASARQRLMRGNLPVALSMYQPTVVFKTAAPVTKGASARIVGCDYVGAFNSAIAADDQVIEITPKNAVAFPRLSAIATAFELYKFLKCRVTMVGLAGATTTGSMSLAPDLYPDGTDFTVAEARNEEGAAICKFWETKSMDFPCVRGTRQWFLTDNAGIATDNDAKLGDVHFSTDALGVQTVADLYIEYDIEFAQGQAVTADALMRSPLFHLLSQHPKGKKALVRFALGLLPPEEREKYDDTGYRKKAVRKVVELRDVDEVIKEMTPSDLLNVHEPSPMGTTGFRVEQSGVLSSTQGRKPLRP